MSDMRLVLIVEDFGDSGYFEHDFTGDHALLPREEYDRLRRVVEAARALQPGDNMDDLLQVLDEAIRAYDAAKGGE